MRIIVQHKTKRVCDALLALAGVQSYSYNEKMFVSNDIDTPGGLPHPSLCLRSCMGSLVSYVANMWGQCYFNYCSEIFWPKFIICCD